MASSDTERFPVPQEIAEEHSAIQTIMRWVEAELTRAGETPEGLRGDGPLLGPLESFRDHLQSHFAFEERSGFFRSSMLALPDGQALFLDWKEQHASLLERLGRCLEGLREASKRGAALPSSFPTELRGIFEALRKHEAEENLLLGKGGPGASFRSRQADFERY